MHEAEEAQRAAERKAEEAQRQQKTLLLQLLGQRFGTLPPNAVAHVNAVSSNDLVAMTLRILSAPSLAEVLAIPDKVLVPVIDD